MKKLLFLIVLFCPAYLFSQTLGNFAGDSNYPDKKYGYFKHSIKYIPEILKGGTWLDHYKNDLLPFWASKVAIGEPLGNFPTARNYDGTEGQPSYRTTRMISRQIYAYAMGFMMTGDEKLLKYAKAGCEWIYDHSKDKIYGGFYEKLTKEGKAEYSYKSAQDTAYCVIGPAAYFFVTRDPIAERVILETRDLIFNPKKFWDSKNNLIKNALTTDLKDEVDGDWALVAQLDQMNAYLLLVQPVLSEKKRREQFLNDLKRLANVLIDNYWQDGLFWHSPQIKGSYNQWGTDFGHTLKSYWMILQTDKRLPDHPFYDFLEQNVHMNIMRAYDDETGRWVKRMLSPQTVEHGSDWWSYDEADQLVSTFNMMDFEFISIMTNAFQNWLNCYVDKKYKEVYTAIDRDGKEEREWSLKKKLKCYDWKSGYHTTEHALVLYILGNNLEKKPVELYFAVPKDRVGSFTAKPYFFDGTEIERKVMGDIEIDGFKLKKVRVKFEKLY